MTLFRKDKKTNVSSETFIALVTPHEEAIWRLCCRLLGNPHDAEDAVQETMLRAWRQIESFRGEASVKSWLYRIAVNYCTDQLRIRARRPETVSVEGLSERGFEPPAQTANPASEMESKDRREAVRHALECLSEEQRVPLILFAQEGMKYEAIAELLGIATGTVKSRIARARIRLIEILNPESGNKSGDEPSKKMKGGHGV